MHKVAKLYHNTRFFATGNSNFAFEPAKNPLKLSQAVYFSKKLVFLKSRSCPRTVPSETGAALYGPAGVSTETMLYQTTHA
jgi:hypothetical protein